jgi:hypothetical protein
MVSFKKAMVSQNLEAPERQDAEKQLSENADASWCTR